ncbi:MAG: hypothetical protein F6K39_33925 [Okeania sp. SIO3B3]|nr:hypothetical protein [Okeania sp. SIO3B3]
MQISYFFSFEVHTQKEKEFLDSWEKLKTKLKQTRMVDAELYEKIVDKENHGHLSTWRIQTSWYSWKDFIYAISTKEFRYFIEKWKVKEASPDSYPLISNNQFSWIRRKISNDFFMVIFFFAAVIIVGIILYLR